MVVAVMVAAGGCADPGHFSESRAYGRTPPLYADEAECLAANPDPLYVCHQFFEFCHSGTATAVFSDVRDTGVYELSGDQVEFRRPPGLGNVPEQIVFTLAPDDTLSSAALGPRPFTRDPTVTFCAP